MDVYEISGFQTGVENSGVNFLDPADAFEFIKNGYIYRQELLSRKGFSQFGNRLSGETRVLGIFENVLPNEDKELLIIDKLYLYKYNTGTNQFDQIPFNSADPIVDFGIAANDAYVSGTTYLTKDGLQRFVFTGKGMDDIYFYDGTDVKRFTNAVDNPDYEAPPEGALIRATKIVWFGERLNLFVPVIGAITYHQGMLYSGIRDNSGKGDKFNVVGAGLISADTYELMKGQNVLGDMMILNFQRSTWSIEKTRDVFNPYFIRKIPSVLGTDSTFSTVAWNYTVKSIGKTGLIDTDGRQSLRFDNKIPYFTRDDVDQNEFELIYGGLSRDNAQFMFSYRDAASQLTDTTQDKVLCYNYEEKTWSVYDQRFSVFGQTDEGQNLTWNDIDETENPSWAEMDSTEEIWDKIGIGESTQKTLAGDNEGFIYQINTDYDDYFVNISGITQAASAVITVDPSAFKLYDRVVIMNVEGMTEINGAIATVTASTDTTITVNINSTGFTAYTGGGIVSKTIQFEAQLTTFNPYRDKGRKVYVSHMEFLLNIDSGDVTIEAYEDEEESPFKTSHLIPNTDTTRKREWINVPIDQESNFMNFRIKRESFNTQTIISAIRIYASQGAYTSG